MEFFYAIMWFAIGLILIFSISKENKIFYFAGSIFLFLGAWWLCDGLFPALDIFNGTWGIVLKCITGVALAILAYVFVKEYRKKGKDVPREPEEQQEKK